MKLAEPPEPCDCCVGKEGWRRMTCVCDCHAGPPFSLALLCRTLTQMQGKPHLR